MGLLAQSASEAEAPSLGGVDSFSGVAALVPARTDSTNSRRGRDGANRVGVGSVRLTRMELWPHSLL